MKLEKMNLLNSTDYRKAEDDNDLDNGNDDDDDDDDEEEEEEEEEEEKVNDDDDADAFFYAKPNSLNKETRQHKLISVIINFFHIKSKSTSQQ